MQKEQWKRLQRKRFKQKIYTHTCIYEFKTEGNDESPV